MALGKLKCVNNVDARFGADPQYWFVKVQTPGMSEHNEEYWLVTEEEVLRFEKRAVKNPEDEPNRARGVLSRVANLDRMCGSADTYLAVHVLTPDNRKVVWLLTDFDLERVRERVAKNAEDIEANREGWLADLFD